jgi:hypothetical protein
MIFVIFNCSQKTLPAGNEQLPERNAFLLVHHFGYASNPMHIPGNEAFSRVPNFVEAIRNITIRH